MKKIILLSTMFSLIIFSACNKETKDDMNPEKIQLEVLPTNDLVSTDNGNAAKAAFKINNRDNTLYEKDDLLVTNSSVNAVSYHWDFGNGDTSTEAQPNYKYDFHGYYTITLTITDADDVQHKFSDDVLVYCVFANNNHDQ